MVIMYRRVRALLLTTSVTIGPLPADEDEVKKARKKTQATTATAPKRTIVFLLQARLYTRKPQAQAIGQRGNESRTNQIIPR